MAGGNVEKGQRYIAALDQARAQGKWEEVPELIRKVTKHAPQKTCVIQTATAESRVVSFIHQKNTTETTATPNLPELIPALLTTIENNDGTPQEILQAQVCLGWVHWTLNEPALAAARLPKDFAATVDALLSEGHDLSDWTEVCLVKGCYIKGSAQSTVASIDESLETFAALIQWLGNGKLINNANSQFLSWSETLLGKGAVMASEEAGTATPYSDPRHVEIALRLFRLWAVHPAVKQGQGSPKAAYAGAPGQPSRTSIWKSYYLFLTIVLQDGLPYPPSHNTPERPQLASEIRRVEAICESNLLREVKFPTASSDNSQVEEWVEQVISNWEVLCGPDWQDQDLGEGGQNAVGRNVLDILYRAATKTYHSHLILKRLFHVHAALADFDLAFKALDSYIEIVTAAKKRAEKSAEYGELEKDEILLQTLSEAVTLLSCLGSFEEAEKAKDLTELIREYIDKQATSQTEGQSNGKLLLSHGPNCADSPDIPIPILAASYRAVGVGLANWASHTPLNEARDEIRGEAIDYLEKSINPEFGQDTDFAALYTLSLTLAENRDLDAAIDYAKSALTSHNSTPVTEDLSKQRDLVSLWHLLALLLSAKQEFDIAERSCEAAFEHFPLEIFSKGHRDRRSSRQSQNGLGALKRSLVSRLQGREKERIIETRITQLAFTEVLEGPEAAVNQTGQLLSLFGKLFQELDLDDGNKLKSDHLVPPKSSAGQTTKSFRSSIFHRNRMSQLPDRSTSSHSATPPVPALPNGHFGYDAPEIQVTDEDHESNPRLGRSDSKKLRERSGSSFRSEQAPAPPPHENEVGIAVSGNSTPVPREHSQSPHVREPITPNPNYKVPSYPVGHEDRPTRHSKRPAPQRFDSPTSVTTNFSITQSKKHALALLVKIWLVIAGLYRRASLFDDAREACEEASKQTAQMEALVAAEESSARHLSERGWTAAKSSEELWADVHAEEGLLAQAQDRPHQAMKYYEDALLCCPEHPIATIALANLLLDIWDEKLLPESTKTEVDLNVSRLTLLSSSAKLKSSRAISADELKAPEAAEIARPVSVANNPHEVDPKHLHRLAARDRAYGLLSILTKLGSSWDNSEAWYALSRAYEAGEQVEKLKEVLWWCIELEDRRPIRHWSNIGSGLYVL
ncbi:Tetratricopeptide-like helical [Penicillium lividum]|nr:Tetratricopeptide-like helical [Penicillium lividum]